MTATAGPFFQVGIIVPDLEPAMEELGAALGLSWGLIRGADYESGPIRYVFSIDGPPHLELIEGPSGGPWSSEGGPRIDHIGFWSPDVAAGKRQLEAKGLPIEVDGEDYGNGGFTYHRAPACGMRVELVSHERRDGLYASLDGAPR